MVQLSVKNNNDKSKVKDWLEVAAYNLNDNEEILKVIRRLEREIEYDQNWESDEYKAYKKANEKPVKLGDKEWTEEDLKEAAESYLEKYQEDIKKAEGLLKADHTVAVNWMVSTGTFLDDEALLYGNSERFGNIKPELDALQNMFIEYVHHLAKGIDKHELYNDQVDEWYFQLKDTDRKFEKSEYFFPTEVFVFNYKGHTWYYSETHGQGTSFGLCVLDNDGVDKLMKDYGLSREDFDEKVYYI